MSNELSPSRHTCARSSHHVDSSSVLCVMLQLPNTHSPLPKSLKLGPRPAPAPSPTRTPTPTTGRPPAAP